MELRQFGEHVKYSRTIIWIFTNEYNLLLDFKKCENEKKNTFF